MPRSLVDTDTLSEVLKGRNPTVLRKAGHYLTQFGWLTFSLITRYEVLRGLKARGATTQLAEFERRCQQSDVLPITDPVIVRAADLYAQLRATGMPISDADLIIAATALDHGLVLVTSNTAHFSRIPGLALDNWTSP